MTEEYRRIAAIENTDIKIEVDDHDGIYCFADEGVLGSRIHFSQEDASAIIPVLKQIEAGMFRRTPRTDLIAHIRQQIEDDPQAYANDAKLKAVADILIEKGI